MKKNKNAVSIELAHYISSFISDYAPSKLTDSSHTVRSYEVALTLYVGFLEEKCSISPEKFTMECFDQKHLEDWITWLSEERGCSISTCNNRLSAMRAFARYLSSRDIKYISLNTDAQAVRYKKAAKKKIKGLSKDSVKAILEVPDSKTKVGLRDTTLMITLYGTAARIDELLSVKISDSYLNAAKPYMIITGKGGKMRTLYLLPKAVAFLRLYIKQYHSDNPSKESYLFYSSIKGKGYKLSQQAVFKLLRKYAALAHEKCDDVPLELHAHQFRHAKASHWLEDGMNVVQISFLLGHSSVETTMVYLDITTELEAKALATIEGEKNQNVSKKWDPKTDTLSDLCGLKKLKK